MLDWFWYFFLYSLMGFFIEVTFTRITGGVKRDRKCRYLLPLCPVYGLGAVALLLLPPWVRENPLLLFPAAALLCTAVEYLVGLFYERVAKVSFWDYSHLPLNLGGKVCLLFSLFWGFLALALFHISQPMIAPWAAAIPTAVTLPVMALTLLDGAFTLHILRRERHTGALRWYARFSRPRKPA